MSAWPVPPSSTGVLFDIGSSYSKVLGVCGKRSTSRHRNAIVRGVLLMKTVRSPADLAASSDQAFSEQMFDQLSAYWALGECCSCSKKCVHTVWSLKAARTNRLTAVLIYRTNRNLVLGEFERQLMWGRSADVVSALVSWNVSAVPSS